MWLGNIKNQTTEQSNLDINLFYEDDTKVLIHPAQVFGINLLQRNCSVFIFLNFLYNRWNDLLYSFIYYNLDKGWFAVSGFLIKVVWMDAV